MRAHLHLPVAGLAPMDLIRTLLSVCALVLVACVSARPQPRDGSLVLAGKPQGDNINSLDRVPSSGLRTVVFDFKDAGGALEMLGAEQLVHISAHTGLRGDIGTLAAHLNQDDDLVSAA
jgi:hypothetical protein